MRPRIVAEEMPTANLEYRAFCVAQERERWMIRRLWQEYQRVHARMLRAMKRAEAEGRKEARRCYGRSRRPSRRGRTR